MYSSVNQNEPTNHITVSIEKIINCRIKVARFWLWVSAKKNMPIAQNDVFDHVLQSGFIETHAICKKKTWEMNEMEIPEIDDEHK